MNYLHVEEGKSIACNLVIELGHFQPDLCHPAVDMAGGAVINQAPSLAGKKASPFLCGGSSDSHEAESLSDGAGVGWQKNKQLCTGTACPGLPSLIPMVLPSKPCPAASHSCGHTGMELPIQPFGKISPTVKRHLFPWENVLSCSNE